MLSATLISICSYDVGTKAIDLLIIFFDESHFLQIKGVESGRHTCFLDGLT